MLTRAAVLSGLVLLAPSLAAAQQSAEWYGGATIAIVDIRFEPVSTAIGGSTAQRFTDHARSQGTDILFARRYFLSRRLSLAGQATFSTNRAKLTTSRLGEQAELESVLPYSFVGSAVPEVWINPRWSAFGDVGRGTGRIHTLKNSASSSTYDISTWRPVVSLGLGVRVRLGAGIDLHGEGRWLRYGAIEYDMVNSAGTPVEHVTDAPRARGFSIGFVRPIDSGFSTTC